MIRFVKHVWQRVAGCSDSQGASSIECSNLGSKRKIDDNGKLWTISDDDCLVDKNGPNKKQRHSAFSLQARDCDPGVTKTELSKTPKLFGNERSNFGFDEPKFNLPSQFDENGGSVNLDDVIYVRKSLLSPEQLEIAAKTERQIKARNGLRTLRNKAIEKIVNSRAADLSVSSSPNSA